MKSKRFNTMLISILASCLLIGCSTTKRDLYIERVMKSLKSIRAGDWVLYYINKDIFVRVQAMSRDKDGVMLEYRTYIDRNPRATGTMQRLEFKDIRKNLEGGFDMDGKIPYFRVDQRTENIQLNKYFLPSVKWGVLTRDGWIYQWFSDEIPIWGIAKQKRGEKYTMLASAWGRAGEKILNWPSDLPPINSYVDMSKKKDKTNLQIQ